MSDSHFHAGVRLAVVGRWQYTPIRYYLPVEPALLLAPALALAAGVTSPGRYIRCGTTAGLIVVLGYTLAFTISTTARFTDDTRLHTERWLRPLAEDGSSILLVGAQWYLPDPNGPGVTRLPVYGAMPRTVKHRRPDYVVLTSLHYPSGPTGSRTATSPCGTPSGGASSPTGSSGAFEPGT
jgi:hypothetical protein